MIRDSDKSRAGNPHIVCVGLIIILILTFYYPVLSGGTIDLDDTSLVADLNIRSHAYNFKKRLIPDSPVTYYRPILILTYVLDQKIWQFSYSGYHLTNVLFHLANTIMVYIIAVRLFRRRESDHWPEVLTALCFGLHPLTSESVAWIAGRSDIVSLFFSLIAIFIYLSETRGRPFFTAVFFYLGILSKENALAVFPLLILYEWFIANKGQPMSMRLKRSSMWFFALLVPFFLYVYARTAGFDLVGAEDEIMYRSGKALESNVQSSFMIVFKGAAAIAFYIKKLFFPFPLNFAINTIRNNLYFAVFLVGCLACVLFYIKKLFGVLFFLCIIPVTFSPALLLLGAEVAWMPYAERYLYLSIALVLLGLGKLYFVYEDRLYPWKKALGVGGLTVMIIFGLSIIQRNLQWSDKKLIWADTFKKNPDSPRVLYKYGTLLGPDKGIEHIRKAVEIAGKRDWLDLSLLSLAEFEKNNGYYGESVQAAKKVVSIAPNVRNYNEARRIVTEIERLSTEDRENNIRFIIHCSEELYRMKRHPNDLYQIASWQAELKNNETAISCYKELISTYPDSRLVKYALKELKELGENL